MVTRRVTAGRTDGRTSEFAELEARLGYRFLRLHLLRLALTHRSYSYESRGVDERSVQGAAIPGDDNEQMEFVGDAVLGLVVAESLFRQFPQCSEGELTRLRASLVSRKRLGDVGADLGLGDHLILGKSAEQVGGRRKPALLANASEAVFAAVYLDGGLEAARQLIERAVVQPEMAALREALTGEKGGALRDHKTLLQERVQATGLGTLRYVDAGQSGPAHERQFRVEAQLQSAEGTRVLAAGEGSSKKEAQQRAAELSLADWNTATADSASGDAA